MDNTENVADRGLPAPLMTLLNWQGTSPQLQIKKSAETLSSWLDINRLDRYQCIAALEGIRRRNSTVKNSRDHLLSIKPNSILSSNDAWKLAFSAFVEACPSLTAVAETVYRRTPKCLEPREEKFPASFSYDLKEKLPFVSVHYRGTLNDLLAVAHEFGHAAQLTATNKSPKGISAMPPIARECCAFLAELFLIRYVQQHRSFLTEKLTMVWERDNDIYFGEDANSLRSAFITPGSTYNYRWNYPLARLYAQQLWEKKSQNIARLFASGSRATELLSQSDITTFTR